LASAEEGAEPEAKLEPDEVSLEAMVEEEVPRREGATGQREEEGEVKRGIPKME